MIAFGFALASGSRRWRALIVSGCVAGAALAAGSADAAADAALLDAARRAQPAVVESLKDMVLIESGSANTEGLAKMADYTERRLKQLGAQTERIKATKGPGTLVKGTFTGNGTRRLMLMAHMDTVYPANSLATQPYRLDGNKLYGPASPTTRAASR
jgi:glutamate carboxypeptidase